MQLFNNTQAPPPQVFPQRAHPQPPVGLALPQQPIQTNNTFNNFLLDDQTCPMWTLPYLIWATKDGNADFGMAVNHTEQLQQVFGPDASKDTAQFYFNPPKIKLFTFSAAGWGPNTAFRMVLNGKLYSTVQLAGRGTLTMPLVYGMGFVTGIYQNEQPVIHSAVGVQEFRNVGLVNNGKTAKYVVKLFNQVVWTLYVSGNVQFGLADPNHIVAAGLANCVVQLCRGDSPAYDAACGKYPVSASVYGEADPSSNSATYGFQYNTEGESSSGSGIVWALPHHIGILDPETNSRSAQLHLDSPTKGVMQAYVTDRLNMKVTNVPADIGLDPWTSVPGFHYDSKNYTDSVRELIRRAAQKEVQHDVEAACDLDSMYFGGKQLDKYAYIAYVTYFVLRDAELTQTVLPKVKRAIEKYARNQQKHPLCYDITWKGLISTAAKEEDFGNSNYNDHHFHYGYHVHAIALVASIDPSWLNANNNLVLNYALALARDYGNFSAADPYFPQTRNFDWYHGHSWAHGIFPSGDGKNEESLSEDYHSVYGLKLLGKVLGDKEMEAGAALMLAIMQDSLNLYMLYSEDNAVQPEKMKRNKVSGIFFENKVDHATFFGFGTIGNEFVHGIHMLPITPVSSYIRGAKYSKEEWDAKLKNIVDKILDGWQGVLRLNGGLFDPRAAWQWFARSNWEDGLIDGGMSRTWSLAYLAGIGGAA